MTFSFLAQADPALPMTLGVSAVVGLFGEENGTGPNIGKSESLLIGPVPFSSPDPLSSGQSHLFLADGHVEPARYKGRIVGGTWNNASWSRMWCKDEIPVQR